MKDNYTYLQHIMEAIEKIEKYIAEYGRIDVSQQAIERNIEIIGEAANNLSLEFRQTFQNIPWRKIINMRNIIIHDYMGINPLQIWETVEVYIPELKQQISAILRNREET